MYYVGVDLHKHTSWFYVLNQKGDKVSSKSIPNIHNRLVNYFSTIPKPFVLAVEATYNWYFFVDLARNFSDQIFLANSYELKAFAKRHKKTDKIDSRLIADILRKGFLPKVTIADKDTRELRELLRSRINLITDRSRNIFRLKNLLDKLGLDSSGNFTTYKRLNQIKSYKMQDTYLTIVNDYIKRIEFLTSKATELEKYIQKVAKQDELINILMTIPGLGYFGAAVVKTEIIDINRFKSFNRLCAYAGLSPKVYSSGSKLIHGSLNTNRRKFLQWILLENVYHFINASPDKLQRYQAIKDRKGHNVAKVVLARDMLKVIYSMMKNQRGFYYSENKNSGMDKKTRL